MIVLCAAALAAPRVFAELEPSTPVYSAEPLGPLIRTRLVDYYAPAKLFVDDAGRAAYQAEPDGPIWPLPFSEPIQDVWMDHSFDERRKLACGLTADFDTLCLQVEDSMAAQLQSDAPDITEWRLSGLAFTRIEHNRVCVDTGRREKCGWLARDGTPRLLGGLEPEPLTHTARWDPASAHDLELASPWCQLDRGEISCSGPSAYGGLGNGYVGLDVRESRVGLADVDVLVAADAAFCALEHGRVWCWGGLGTHLPVATGASLPQCPIDPVATERLAIYLRLLDRFVEKDLSKEVARAYDHTTLCGEREVDLLTVHARPTRFTDHDDIVSLTANLEAICIVRADGVERCWPTTTHIPR